MRKSNKPKVRKGAWFYPLRGSYLPCSWQGWLVEVAVVVAFLVGLLAFNNQELSIQVMFVVMATYSVALAVVATWIAKQKS